MFSKTQKGLPLSDKKLINSTTLFDWGDVPEWVYSATKALLESLKKNDILTYEHCLRVGEYSRLLAKSAGLNEFMQKQAEFSGLLHDIGKVGVAQSIIDKPGRLTQEEMLVMKDHPVYSEEIIKPLGHEMFFKAVVPAVRHHHERIDGEGYPDKRIGDEIPLYSRIILIVDTLDAMGKDRAYRKGLPLEVIYKELERCMGTQFDAQLTKIFLESHKHWHKETRELYTYEQIIKKVA